MHWFRRASPAVFLFLTVLLHCSQTCLAAGHAHAAITVPTAADHSLEHPPCHSSSPAQRLPEKCPDCGDHVFLTPGAAGAEMLVLSGSSHSLFCVLPPLLLLSQAQSCPPAVRPAIAALSPPRYLTFSILRL